MRQLTLPLFVFFLLACSGSIDSGSFDSGDTTSADDTGGQGDTGDTDDSGTPDATDYQELGDPCGGTTPYAMYFEDADAGWVGCGDGMGLWRTEDAGDSFSAGHPSTGTGDLYVNQVVPDPAGGVLVCGHDYAQDPGVFLYRYRDGDWTALLSYGSNNNDPAWTQMANCGVVAAAGDGTMLVASDTVGDMSRSTDHGVTWTTEYRYWEDANLDDGGYSYFYMLNLVAAGGAYYGAGSRIVEPPVFYGPSQHADGDWYNFHATEIADLQGEVWALATPDDGVTWFAGGRDQARSSSASGFLFRSDDGGATWTDVSLGGTVDIMHDLEFAEDGLHGVAVGHRYPPSSQGGFVATTDDGGQTWVERAEDVPPLYTAAIVGDTFWVAGDAYLARGVISGR